MSGINLDISASEVFSKANAAFVAEEYAKAEQLYTRAISLDDRWGEYYVNRAHTLQKLDRYEDSKRDAEKAIDLNLNDAKAYLRKGIACFHLLQYTEAKEAFKKSLQIEDSNPGIRQWLTWTDEKLSKLKKPSSPEPNEGAIAQETQPVIKHDWYQTESHVYVTVLAKNLDPTAVHVEFTRSTMSITAKLPDDRDYSLNLNLSYSIVPEHSSYKVLKTKVEIKMKKCDGIRWNTLEGQVPVNIKKIPLTITNTSLPVYPSSATKKRDWDKIESEIKKEEAEEKPEGEAALNQLFQKIYTDGSDEIRRAMNKSFQESGGTVLSTNWNEVAKDKVTVKPPDGMEYRKWDE